MNTIFEYVPRLFINRMQATVEILKKVPDFAAGKNMTEADILDTRLAPDMLPLKRQVQIMADNAKAFCVRLNKMENPVWEDTETTVEELIARLERAIEFMQDNPVTDYEAAREVTVTMQYIPNAYIESSDYMIEFLIPNFHFHATIFYAILRHLGMTLGKADYVKISTYHSL